MLSSLLIIRQYLHLEGALVQTFGLDCVRRFSEGYCTFALVRSQPMEVFWYAIIGISLNISRRSLLVHSLDQFSLSHLWMSGLSGLNWVTKIGLVTSF